MDEKQLNNVASLLSLFNFILNQESLSNQDLAKMLDEKTHKILVDLEKKLDIIIEQNKQIISFLK